MAVVSEIIEPQCQALNLSDSLRCTAQATANNDLFCGFHAKQCFGLYIGYKRRNAVLDSLVEKEPAFLRNAGVSLVSQTFSTVEQEADLRELHAYLLDQYVLLGKVINARKLHHKHFYPLELDYGHKAYLDKLVNQRHSVLKALENLEKRTATVLYEKEKWFAWVRQTQESEEEHREKEQKKIKLEAAMFRRHWREMEARLTAARQKEDQKRQEVYLDEVWRKRMEDRESGNEEGEDLDAWDPIEDAYIDDRDRFIDLIRHFLWMDAPQVDGPDPDEPSTAAAGTIAETGAGTIPVMNQATTQKQKQKAELGQREAVAGGTTNDKITTNDTEETAVDVQKKKTRKRGKKKKTEKSDQPGAGTLATVTDARDSVSPNPQTRGAEPNKGNIESKDEIRQRLREGVKKDYSHVEGPMIVGTATTPHELAQRTAPVPQPEIEKLISEIAEIKALLFCRHLLSHSALLPAAVRANSVQEFLADPAIAESDLRDLCLQVEQPSLEALRDACADLVRGAEPDDDEEEEAEEEEERSVSEWYRHHLRYGHLESLDPFNSLMYDLLSPDAKKRIKVSEHLDELDGPKRAQKEKKIKIKVCGKSIWNYSSQRSLARDGWLQFSIMAKDCHFHEAIGLCRNWDEFFDLNILALWQYFPASKWSSWSGNFFLEELTKMGFIPVHYDLTASRETTYNQLNSNSRSVLRRQAIITEARNFICAHMKRNDPITRRFIQYALMRTGEILILVRDGLTGRIIVAPDNKGENWLVRSRPGHGFTTSAASAAKEAWFVEKEVGIKLFLETALKRKWHFGFDAYYEIYMWDFAVGESPIDMQHRIKDLLLRAWRVRNPGEMNLHMKPILETLTREPVTMRVRHLNPGEDAPSIYDDLMSPSAELWLMTKKGKKHVRRDELDGEYSKYSFYNDTDAAEDAVLFEEENAQGFPENVPFVEITNPIRRLETGIMPETVLNVKARQLEKLGLSDDDDDDDDDDDIEERVRKRSDKFLSKFEDGLDLSHNDNPIPTIPTADFIYSVPPVWEQVHHLLESTSQTPERAAMLDRLDFQSMVLKVPLNALDRAGLPGLELMERDRSYLLKESFHLADLEPGAQERYHESMRLIIGMQKYQPARPRDNWAWFCLELLDRMKLKMYYDDYVPEPTQPWPHRYIMQDVVQAFMMMGLFFPELQVTAVVRDYLETEEGSVFKQSGIFDQAGRSKQRPDTRTRTSGGQRPTSFWKQWHNILRSEGSWIDNFPWDWNMAIRPILAKLYRAGIVFPAYLQPHTEICPGLATANTEPHRPGVLDLFINYERKISPSAVPPNYLDYKDWPTLLPKARAFAQKHGGTTSRFALLRLWSAPHFYPLMIHGNNVQAMSFIDSVGRAWCWRFVPKDMAMSEWSVHNNVRLRLGYLREQMVLKGAPAPANRRPKQWADPKFSADDKWAHGSSEMDERVTSRGDLVLVMGTDAADLLRWCTAVVFSLQSKPWMREIDLWKSFINVDLAFLEGLDEYWLD